MEDYNTESIEIVEINQNSEVESIVLPCDQLVDIEEFQDITPPELKRGYHNIFPL